MPWNNDYYGAFAPYVSVDERRAQARAKAAHLERNGRKLKPVQIEGTRIAETFWGKAWCKHIETYSDLATRLPRGRSYARHGAVIDLQLEKGRVTALVSGSALYTVEISIEQLPRPQWRALVNQCAGKIESVVELLTGELSDRVMEILCEPTKGLFPASRHLGLDCSCPDSARLCKHLAAVLYGIGARLDREPELFFILRGVDKLDLIDSAGASAVLGAKRSRVKELKTDALADIFGIEMEVPAPKAQKKSQKKKKTRAKARRSG